MKINVEDANTDAYQRIANILGLRRVDVKTICIACIRSAYEKVYGEIADVDDDSSDRDEESILGEFFKDVRVRTLKYLENMPK